MRLNYLQHKRLKDQQRMRSNDSLRVRPNDSQHMRLATFHSQNSLISVFTPSRFNHCNKVIIGLKNKIPIKESSQKEIYKNYVNILYEHLRL